MQLIHEELIQHMEKGKQKYCMKSWKNSSTGIYTSIPLSGEPKPVLELI